ncbi:hypothetical protein M9458_032402, partial [Cirrhinus mrigala]
HRACTCPGCPLSSSPSSSSVHTLKPRTSPPSQIQPPSSPLQQTKEPSPAPVGLGLCLGLGLSLEEENPEPSSTSAHPQQEDKGTSTHSPIPQANPEPFRVYAATVGFKAVANFFANKRTQRHTLPTTTTITTTITARSHPAHRVRFSPSLACPANAPSPPAPSSCGISKAMRNRKACSSSHACTAMLLSPGRLNCCSTSEPSMHPKL